MKKDTGAQFEISVDGKRSYRDIKAVAIASAEFLKSRNPNSNVAVKDLRTGEVTPVAFRPQRGAVNCRVLEGASGAAEEEQRRSPAARC
jgi:hypothetical protein